MGLKKVIAFTVVFLSLQSQAQAPADITEAPIPVKEEACIQPGIDGYWIVMEVTAYTLDYECCGKYPDDPDYGITSSSKEVKEYHTIAAGPSIPFGTQIYIPMFLQYFTVEDRGSAIGDGNLDIYMAEIDDAKEFGRQTMEVFIVQE